MMAAIMITTSACGTAKAKIDIPDIDIIDTVTDGSITKEEVADIVNGITTEAENAESKTASDASASTKADAQASSKSSDSKTATGNKASAGTSKQPATTKAPAQQTTKAAQPAEQKTTQHTHSYTIPVYKTVHHDAVGHYETVTVQAAWDEPITEDVQVCNGCGKVFAPSQYGSAVAADNAVIEHVGLADFWSDCDSYHSEPRVIGKKHHEAITEQRYVIDSEAWNESVIDYYKCSCGARQ